MAQTTPTAETAPTVVLVHGAFADAGSWAGVVLALQAAGVNVQAPANPLRGVSSDAAYLASVANQIPGPVLLVGHSYGGVVISNASPMAENVVGLVYIAAYLPDEGETLQAMAEQATDSLVGPALRPAQFPTGDSAASGTEFYVDPARSPRSSPPICRRSRPRCWPPASGQSRPWLSANRPGRLVGSRFPRGRQSPRTIWPSGRPVSASWPSVPAPKSWRSTARIS